MVHSYPPAGSPLSFKDIVLAAFRSITGNPDEKEIRRKVKEYFGCKECFFLSSGRASLTVILKALSELNRNKRCVILPAYTCYSVPASVIRAGLKVRFCDFKPNSFEYDIAFLEHLLGEDVLAIVAVHPYGFAVNIDEIAGLARKYCVFLIEDAAQAFGAEFRKEKLGNFGDAGFFSLSKGKSITAMNGGIIISERKDVIEKINAIVSKLRRPPLQRELFTLFKAIGYYVFSRPLLYGWVKNIPILKIGMNTFDSNFNIEKLGRVACNLFSLAFERLDRTNAARKIIAGLYLRELGLKDIFIPSYPDLNGAAPIRFPVLVENGWLRSKWLEKFGGYGISQSYPLDLPSLHICRDDPTGEEMPCPNAKSIAARIITLPTNFLLRENIARIILTCLSKIADAKR